MHPLLRAYLVAGIAFMLGVYAIMLAVWFDATLNGAVNGAYVVTINTDALGESDLVLALLFLFLPVAVWAFTRGIRRALTQQAS